MYENTTPHTHRVAAELIEAGVDVDDIYRRLYEHVPLEKLRLVARALGRIAHHCDGRLVLTYITADDYAATGAGEEMTEGVIDHLRSIEGTKVAAVVRDLGDRGRAARKVSLRSSDGDVDVSVIARKNGGGGHKRAAGFSTDSSSTSWSRSSATRSAPSSALRWRRQAGGAVLLYDKPAGVTSHDVVARVRRELGCKAGHAGTLDPFATGLLLILLGRATRLQRFLVGLPKTYLATARLGWRSSTGDPDGELTETGRVPRSLRAADRHGAPAGADDLGRPGRRRAPLQEGPPRRGGRDARCATSRSTAPSCSPSDGELAHYEIDARPGPTSAP